MREFRKKRCTGWRALLCMVCALFVLFGVSVQAFAAGTASISGAAVVAEKGETVTIHFTLTGNPGIWGAKCEISYDASALTLKAVDAGNVFSSSEIITGEDMKQNPLVFLATASTIADKTNNGTLVKATFLVHSDAKLGDYTVGIKVVQLINTDGEDVPCDTTAGKVSVVKCAHRSTEVKNAVEATEEADGYTGDTYCKKCQALVKKGSVIPQLVNTCTHANQNRTVITEATCEKSGTAKLSCADCGKELAEVEILPVGHVESAPQNAKAATTTEEGYTGDIYCENCNELLTEGTAISKIPVQVFNMSMQTEDTYLRKDPAGLIFVSEAELETFVRVEINGAVVDPENYTLESGSTKVTLKPEYLETLPDGKHTITIVSDAGTASAQFYVAEEKEGASPVLLIITIVAVVIMLGCVAVTVFIVMTNKKNGRYIRNDA